MKEDKDLLISKTRICSRCKESILLKRQPKDKEYVVMNGDYVCYKCLQIKKRYSEQRLENVSKVMKFD